MMRARMLGSVAVFLPLIPLGGLTTGALALSVATAGTTGTPCVPLSGGQRGQPLYGSGTYAATVGSFIDVGEGLGEFQSLQGTNPWPWKEPVIRPAGHLVPTVLCDPNVMFSLPTEHFYYLAMIPGIVSILVATNPKWHLGAEGAKQCAKLKLFCGVSALHFTVRIVRS